MEENKYRQFFGTNLLHTKRKFSIHLYAYVSDQTDGEKIYDARE